MTSITESVDVDAPVTAVYNQWTQFEEFPQFMQNIEAVQQLDDVTLHWRASIAGKSHEWDAKITEQHPDERVAWMSKDGTTNAGVVTVHRLNDTQTRVTVQMDWEPEGVVEAVGGALGFDSRSVKADLERFKELVEGAWRAVWRLAWRCLAEQHHITRYARRPPGSARAGWRSSSFSPIDDPQRGGRSGQADDAKR